jgi:hypothetical protein
MNNISSIFEKEKDDIKGVHYGKNSGLVAALPAHYGKIAVAE